MRSRSAVALAVLLTGAACASQSRRSLRPATVDELAGWYANDRGDTVMVMRSTPTRLRFVGLGRLSGTMNVERGGVSIASFDQVEGSIDEEGFVERELSDSSVTALSFGDDPAKHHMLLRRLDDPEIVQREVRFTNGDVRLRGVAFVPTHASRAPGVVFIHGTGAQVGDRPYEMSIARTFLRRGMAVFMFDKRGSGGSTGDWKVVGFRELAGDVAAAIGVLRGMPEVDPKRVGVYGTSEGGWVAPFVNDLVPDLAFIVNQGGPGVEPLEDEADDLRIGIASLRLPPADSTLAMRVGDALLDVYRGPGAFPAYLAARNAVRDKAWFKSAAERLPTSEDNWEIAWWRKRIEVSAIDAWRRRRAPALVLIGERDETMDVAKSVAAFERMSRDTSLAPLVVRRFPRADHSLRIYEGPESGRHFAPGFPTSVADWIERVSPSRG